MVRDISHTGHLDLTDTNRMDKNILVIITVIVILIMVTQVKRSVFKRKRKQQTIAENGARFEAHIIGVAHSKAILNIDGQPNQTAEIFGIQNE
jgi:hypothetical protein